MTNSRLKTIAAAVSEVYATSAEDREPAVPVFLVENGGLEAETQLSDAHRAWLENTRFTGTARKQALVPGGDGQLAGVALGIGDGFAGDPSGPSELLTGQLASSLPPGLYRLAAQRPHAELAAVAWGLGAYRFRRYKAPANGQPARLAIPADASAAAIANTVEAVWLGRDLINTPAADMGPGDIEAAVRDLAGHHGAAVESVVGDELIRQNFPMIHAVGRASSRAPRLIDLRWGREDAPKVTLVGKGISFDTGGLDIKPASGMLLMKKDMGGAAAALALGHMIMGRKLDVRLRIVISAAENSISGDSFRPGDVLKSRAGLTVEVGNTDAEGRLVLADALALADEESPDTLITFATLTGAARTALGPDVPALFTDDDAFAARLVATSTRIGDPVWRLPLWRGYERHLDSDVADTNNIWEAPFAGAITAALFLRKFVRNAKRFAHFDIYGWRTAPRPLGPKGGEPHAARTVFATLAQELVS